METLVTEASEPLERRLKAAVVRSARRLVELRQATRHPGDEALPAVFWEGEDVWNPMLAAQYVIAMHAMGRDIAPNLQEQLIRQFRHEALPTGGHGLHPHGGASMFVTTLVYVALRLLGIPSSDPVLAFARELFRSEDIRSIPTWGKLWLAVANLYSWDGLHAIPPEVWRTPTINPLHPHHYYCHTRLIYLGMAAVSAAKVSASESQLTRELRSELYAFHRPTRYEDLSFDGAARMLRPADLISPPTRRLDALFRMMDLAEVVRQRVPFAAGFREDTLQLLQGEMRFDIRSTDATCLSPVNGLLFALALHQSDPSDPDLEQQLARLQGWIWADDAAGARIAGARSATWDTSFAILALAQAQLVADDDAVTLALREGYDWLLTQQIKEPAFGTVRDYTSRGRTDPRGGFCFAGVWHGWPVSDCTAEALCALIETQPASTDTQIAVARGLEFMLRCQNPEGGFGSYEARKQRPKLEWMNPAEMFGDSMTEHSYSECTASNLVAMRLATTHYPSLDSADINDAIARAHHFLRSAQRADGSFYGAWGVCFVYGTYFGIRGLLAGGSKTDSREVRRACDFLIAHQRPDGSWGEHWRSCVSEAYEDLGHGHVTQTAWALLALIEAKDSRTGAIQKGVDYLLSMQEPNGDFPEQEFAGVFFRSALIEYRLYRRYFPLWALSRAARFLRSEPSERGSQG